MRASPGRGAAFRCGPRGTRRSWGLMRESNAASARAVAEGPRRVRRVAWPGGDAMRVGESGRMGARSGEVASDSVLVDFTDGAFHRLGDAVLGEVNLRRADPERLGDP